MKPAMETKLQKLVARHEEIKTLLSDPAITHDLDRYRALSKAYAQVEPPVAW